MTGPKTGPTKGDTVYTAMGLHENVSGRHEYEIEYHAYVATWWLANRSLTLPPATLKNAEPHRPVIKRKTRNTAMIKRASEILVRMHARFHTDVRREGSWPRERKEESIRHSIDDVPPIEL